MLFNPGLNLLQALSINSITLLGATLCLILFFNLVFLVLQHPLSMIFVLVVQTILVSVAIYMMAHFAWFSYSLILVFLGGMLVIFMYMSNVASNELFKPNFKLMLFFPISTIAVALSGFELSYASDLAMFNHETQLLQISKPFWTSLLPMMLIAAGMIILAMLAVVKITKMQLGPLRIS